MEIIKVDLGADYDNIELHIFADEHIGDNNCDIDRLKERIKYVEETPNAYCVLNGDLMDNATRTSIGDIYANSVSPMKQVEFVVDLFRPIQHKILAITHGNHENRTYRKEGIDLSRVVAAELGLIERYSATSVMLYIQVGQNTRHGRKNKDGNYTKLVYSVYMLHGGGGGRKEGAKAIRLADMAAIVDADIYIHSHTHLPMVMKQAFYRSNKNTFSVTCADKLFVNTAANLRYGGYGEAQEFKPSSMQSPIIYLSGKKFNMAAKL